METKLIKNYNQSLAKSIKLNLIIDILYHYFIMIVDSYLNNITNE